MPATGDLLEMHILRPHPRLTEGGAQGSLSTRLPGDSDAHSSLRITAVANLNSIPNNSPKLCPDQCVTNRDINRRASADGQEVVIMSYFDMRPLHSHPDVISIYRDKQDLRFLENGFLFESPRVRDFTWLKPELNLRISLKTGRCKCGGEAGRTPSIMKMCIIHPCVERLLRRQFLTV